MNRHRTNHHGGRIAVLAVLILAAAFPSLRAQDTLRGGLFGGHFMLVLPQGEFKEGMGNKIGYGFSVDLGYAFPHFPIALGLEGGFAMYGSNTFSVPLGNIKIITVDVTSENSIFLGHLFLRVQPHEGMFRPYFEGLLGLSVFNTSSSVKNQITHEEFASTNNSTDVAFSYGAGAGVAVKVFETREEKDNKTFQIFVDARLRYFYGGEAKYYREDAVYLDNADNVQFDKNKQRTSKTDMLTPHIGVMVRF
jgi:hypothetical protein